MMELDEQFGKVFDTGMELKGVEGTEIVNGKDALERELKGCRHKCKEMEERSKNDEERCMVLELAIEKMKSEFELLEGKFSALEVEKVGIGDEVKVLKSRNTELEKRIMQFGKENNNGVGEKGTEKVVDLTEGMEEEEDMVSQLLIENNVLECEKKKAESDAEVWKLKCRELESRVLELEKENLLLRGKQSHLDGAMKSQPEMQGKQTTNGSDLKDGFKVVATNCEYLETDDGMATIGDLLAAGTPLIDMPSNHFNQVEGRKRGFSFETEKDHCRQVRKQLDFGEEGSLSKKIAPLTPGVARPSSFGCIDISDSEDEAANITVCTPHLESQVNSMARVSTDFSQWDTSSNGNKKTSDDNFKTTPLDGSDEEDVNRCTGNFPVISTPKRKRASNIVTTDSESDSDDNIPICKLKTKHLRELNHDAMDSHPNSFPVTATVSEEKFRKPTTPRRRLVTLRERNVKNGPEQNSPCNAYDGGANYICGIPTNRGVENDDMEEDESKSDTEGESLGGFIVDSSDVSDGDDGSTASEDVSDDDADFGKVLFRIRRSRDLKVKWEFEADMLAAFGKDLQLCMKAVCALYRQQTTDEQYGKFTYYSNHRGFSQCDAKRGCTLAEFLTDGDPKGDLTKSVEELQEYDPNAPELCRTLATHYSKQLFAIYQNKEDPLFLPS